MQASSGVSLWALTMFVAGVTLGVLYLLTPDNPAEVQPAVVHSSEVLEAQKAAGLHTNYRQGAHKYLEVYYKGEWQTLKCTIKGWEQQGLYFRHNLAEVAEGCELEKSVKTD